MVKAKLYDLNNKKDVYLMMMNHRNQIQDVNGMASDSPYKRLQEARDQIILEHLEREDAAAAARKRAEEDAALEEEAADNYTISFTYNVKGGSK